MENYRIYFDETERNDVLRILRKYNDVLIDNIDDHSVGITIERDDSGLFYRNLMDEIDKDVYSLRSESGI
ncbi:MAG TPA: hypothetical protein VEB86_04330 [Chryseosolibacter sp.]|nr:hypothetical protein [Chryseosolibacter sp.]